ncbi:MAG: 6-carboxytetrahydropterin synthase [Candidatus Dormibacteraeota bacterium]|nr:6-carboxytetrahydropterin synthase [Candidatus Dormibacteraeota bacterium]
MDATLELARADIGFSAAHFSVHDGRSERLHGHNYRVYLRLHGTVGAEGTVIDFAALKTALRAVCAELDERMLVPTRSAQLVVAEAGDTVTVTDGDRHFVFPRGDVVLLPIVNSTCECLAAHLLGRLSARLDAPGYRVELRVEETPGQGAAVSTGGGAGG